MPAVLGGIVVGIVLTNVPGGPTVLRFLPPFAVAMLGLLCFGDLARRDRLAFISIVGPALVVAVASTLAVGAWAYLALAAVAFLSLFVFAPDRVWPWWWQHVLRRAAPTAGQKFDRQLAVQLRAFSVAVHRNSAREVLGDEKAAAAREAIAKLSRLTPPDADWAAVQNGYASVDERWILLAQHQMPAELALDLQREMDALAIRRRELKRGA